MSNASGALKRAPIHPEAPEEATTVTLDPREHTMVWVALRNHEAKLREQAADHERRGNMVTVRLLKKSADTCRKLTDDLDAARGHHG